MQESTLIKLSLITVFIGIPILSFLALSQENLNPPLETSEDETITIVGTLEKISHTRATTRLTISYNAKLTAIVFDNISLEPKTKVKVTGTIKDKNLLVESLSRI